MPFRTYADVMSFLARTTNYEKMSLVRATPRTHNLRRVGRVLEGLGHPHERFRSLHIAGTKGKGSTAIFADSLLRACGLRTGLYTSPHLVDMMERIQVGGKPVSRRAFVAVMERMRRLLERIRPTYFEIMTAAALEIFARRGVEAAVLEVGLGGRLDATNVVRPAGCAITRIGYDHTQVLGRTLGMIAREKAGILKHGVPAVVAEQRPSAARAIRREARRVGAPLLRPPPIGHAATFRSRRGFVLEFAVGGACLRVPVAGTHQADNFAVALGLVRTLLDPPRSALLRAVRSIRLPGRIELAAKRPDVVVDGAHNPASAGVLGRALARVAPGGPRVLVFGAPADKDIRGMLRELLPGTDLAVFTRSSSSRAEAPERLVLLAGKTPAVVTGSVAEAVDRARQAAGPGGTVIVTGSFVVAGEALGHLNGRRTPVW